VKRFAVMVFPLALLAHDPITTKLTYNAEISRILATRCLSCHATGNVQLTSYQQVRPWAKAIRDQVLSRKMPPWGAQRGVGQFRNNQALGQPEIDRIVQWVEGGAPEGDGKPAEAVLHLTGSLTLNHPITVTGILPNAPLEAKATRPDGTVEHLIWLKEFHGLTYEFLEPLVFPKGTVLNVTAASAELFLKY
jgi:hypothetical protein